MYCHQHVHFGIVGYCFVCKVKWLTLSWAGVYSSALVEAATLIQKWWICDRDTEFNEIFEYVRSDIWIISIFKC